MNILTLFAHNGVVHDEATAHAGETASNGGILMFIVLGAASFAFVAAGYLFAKHMNKPQAQSAAKKKART